MLTFSQQIKQKGPEVRRKTFKMLLKTEYFLWIATYFYSIKPKHSIQEASGGISGRSSAVGPVGGRVFDRL